jgi:MSHA pilin protein MshC
MKTGGFTVVELVVSIALIAIVAVGTGSRWFSADTFSADTIKSQVLAETRLAQRVALSNSETVVHFTLSQSGNDWVYQIILDDGSVQTVMRRLEVDRDQIGISVSAGSSATLGAGVTLDLSYDGLGNITAVEVGGVSGDPAYGVRISAGTRSLCISPLGFAHDGDCV